MKRIFSVIICCIIVLLSLTACDGGEGIPFITTQSAFTEFIRKVNYEFGSPNVIQLKTISFL